MSIVEYVKKLEKHFAWGALLLGIVLLVTGFFCSTSTNPAIQQFCTGLCTEIGSTLIAFAFIYFIWKNIEVPLSIQEQKNIIKAEGNRFVDVVENKFQFTNNRIFELNEKLGLLPNEVHDVLALDKKIAHLYAEINKNNQLKKELISSIEHFASIHGNSSNMLSGKIPPHVIELFKRETMNKLKELNDALVNCKEGELNLEEGDCIDATMECMRNVKESVFAISFPDVSFWNGQGKSYLEANKQSIIDNGAEVSRFFVIRNTDLDRKVLTDDGERKAFIQVLSEQISINNLVKKGRKGKMHIYITDIRLINLNHIQEGLIKVPDISLYDDETVSEWIERGDMLGRDSKIKTSVISYRRDRLRLALKTKAIFMQNANTNCIELGNGTTPERGVELLIERLKKFGKY